MPTVSKDDLWNMLLSSFRYALGRRTYFVSSVIEMYNKYKDSLEEWQRNQIISEVKEEFIQCVTLRVTLGDPHNHQEWEQFIKDNT